MSEPKQEAPQERKTVVFGSRYSGFMLTLDTGGPRMVNGTYIPKMPYRSVTFNRGVYRTDNPDEIRDMRNSPSFGKDFWEITKPEDTKGVNQGKVIEVANGVRSTASVPGRK
jgi:hypothetical protein